MMMLAGIGLGIIIGMSLMAILTMGKISDYESEIARLRYQIHNLKVKQCEDIQQSILK